VNGLFNLPEGGAGEEEITLPPEATSLDFMQAIYRDPAQPMTRRMRAAVAALPFEHPKLSVNANIDNHFADQIEEMVRRSGRSNVIGPKNGERYDTSAPLQIEAKSAPIQTDPGAGGFRRRL
jgi:hypothetical protein